MAFLFFVTNYAARDMEEIDRYICTHDSPSKTDQVLDQIEMALASLTQSPNRGAYPKELLELGIREYRQIFFNPYRIIYRVLGHTVYVLLIADGRRDLQELLQRRLLEG
jgi:toxin ParE1/3/4